MQVLPRPLTMTGPKALVVAHPDDETMWAGSLPLVIPGDWTIFCCSIPRRDPERAYHFFDACEVLAARPRLIPFVETEPNQPLKQEALNLLDLSRFVCVVTHNEFGEYGHGHHIQVHNFVRQSSRNKMVTFGFGSKHTDPYILPITGMTLSMKLRALRCYRSGDPPKWKALLDRYGPMGYETGIEKYVAG